MRLAGLDLSSAVVSELAIELRDQLYLTTAGTLEHGLDHAAQDVALTIRERTEILDVLIDTPEHEQPSELANLRRTLLSEYTWRVRTSLAGRVA